MEEEEERTETTAAAAFSFHSALMKMLGMHPYKVSVIQELLPRDHDLKCDLMNYDLKNLNCKFDVILIEPPLEEYQRTMGVTNMQFWSWDQIMNLDIGEVAAQRSFVFLWCGSSEGLDMGRVCLRKWGFRR